MGVLLVCDCTAENCYRTTPPIVVNGRPAAPPGWTMLVAKDGSLRVACCDLHLDIIRKKRGTR